MATFFLNRGGGSGSEWAIVNDSCCPIAGITNLKLASTPSSVLPETRSGTHIVQVVPKPTWLNRNSLSRASHITLGGTRGLACLMYWPF